MNDDKEVVRDWDFPFIHRTVYSYCGCLEASVRMVYCAAFYCNANSSENKVTCSWLKFPTEPIFLFWYVVHTVLIFLYTQKSILASALLLVPLDLSMQWEFPPDTTKLV